MPRTTPRHAGISQARRVRSLAWVGAREVFVFAAVGLALPVALLMTLPRVFDAGVSMAGADTCTPDGVSEGCLTATPAAVTSTDVHRLGYSATVGDVELRFAEDQQVLDEGEEVHLLTWEGTGVGVRRADGDVVESLDWGPTYDVDTTPLVWAPLWPLGAAALAALAFRRRHPIKVAVLGVVALGAAAAGPLAWVGLHLRGYDGLVLVGLGTLGLTLIAAGATLALARRLARGSSRPGPAQPASVHLPEQRAHRVSASAAPLP